MEEEIEILPGHAAPPGFPQGHGPGRYLVDYEARTIRPVPVEVEKPQPASEIVTESQPAQEETPQVEQGG